MLERTENGLWRLQFKTPWGTCHAAARTLDDVFDMAKCISTDLKAGKDARGRIASIPDGAEQRMSEMEAMDLWEDDSDWRIECGKQAREKRK